MSDKFKKDPSKFFKPTSIEIPIAVDLALETRTNLNGWVRLTKKKEPSSDLRSPWQKGTLLKLIKSPAPNKVPDDSVVMFLDYKCTSYNIVDIDVLLDSGKQQSVIDRQETEKDVLQHCVTVLFNEQIVDLYSQVDLEGVFDEAMAT